MKTLTNRLTEEQMAELRKRLEREKPAMVIDVPHHLQRAGGSAAVPAPQRSYNPVGANIGLSTQYKICGTCGGR